MAAAIIAPRSFIPMAQRGGGSQTQSMMGAATVAIQTEFVSEGLFYSPLLF
jgi:hypothetical protein